MWGKNTSCGGKKNCGEKKNLWGQTSSVYFITKSSLLEDRHMNATWGQIGMEPKMWGQNSVGSNNVGWKTNLWGQTSSIYFKTKSSLLEDKIDVGSKKAVGLNQLQDKIDTKTSQFSNIHLWHLPISFVKIKKANVGPKQLFAPFSC